MARQLFVEELRRDGVAARYGVRQLGGLRVLPRHSFLSTKSSYGMPGKEGPRLCKVYAGSCPAAQSTLRGTPRSPYTPTDGSNSNSWAFYMAGLDA